MKEQRQFEHQQYVAYTDYPLTESSTKAMPLQLSQGYLSREEKRLQGTKPLNDYDLQMYFRKTLVNRGAEPLITDDTPADNAIQRQQIFNLRTNGHRSQFEPFLNEVTLHDNAPDQRHTENIPRFELLKNMTYDKKGRIKSGLHSDGTRFKEVIDVLSQFQEPIRNIDVRNDFKKRATFFDIERQTLNPLAQTGNLHSGTALTEQTLFDQDLDQEMKALIMSSKNDIGTGAFSQTEPDHKIQIADYSQAYYKSYNQAISDTIGHQQLNQLAKEGFDIKRNPNIVQYQSKGFALQQLLNRQNPDQLSVQEQKKVVEFLQNKISHAKQTQIQPLMNLTQNQLPDKKQLLNANTHFGLQENFETLDRQLTLYERANQLGILNQVQRILPPIDQYDKFTPILEEFVEKTLVMLGNRKFQQQQLQHPDVEYEKIIASLAESYTNTYIQQYYNPTDPRRLIEQGQILAQIVLAQRNGKSAIQSQPKSLIEQSQYNQKIPIEQRNMLYNNLKVEIRNLLTNNRMNPQMLQQLATSVQTKSSGQRISIQDSLENNLQISNSFSKNTDPIQRLLLATTNLKTQTPILMEQYFEQNQNTNYSQQDKTPLILKDPVYKQARFKDLHIESGSTSSAAAHFLRSRDTTDERQFDL